MTMETFPLGTTLARPGSIFHPVQALTGMLASWKERRRRKADLALLMSMDPHVLNDIGVKIVHQPFTGAPMAQTHPAVLATTFGIGSR